MVPPARLAVTIRHEQRVVLVLAGELDPSTVGLLDTAVEAALAEGAESLVIDLADVTFLDSSGLRALIGAHTHLAPEPLRLRAPSAAARRLLAITGLDDHFLVEDAPAP